MGTEYIECPDCHGSGLWCSGCDSPIDDCTCTGNSDLDDCGNSPLDDCPCCDGTGCIDNPDAEKGGEA